MQANEGDPYVEFENALADLLQHPGLVGGIQARIQDDVLFDPAPHPIGILGCGRIGQARQVSPVRCARF